MNTNPKAPQPDAQDTRQLALSALKRIRETQDKQKRLQIIQAMASVEGSWACDVLLDALADPHAEIRRYIVDQMSKRENLDLGLLYARLSKPPWNIKIEVLKILGLRKNPLSAKHIEAVLVEPNVYVRRTAAEVLGDIGGKDALSLLVKLTKDKNPFVRRAAEKSLLETSELKFL